MDTVFNDGYFVPAVCMDSVLNDGYFVPSVCMDSVLNDGYFVPARLYSILAPSVPLASNPITLTLDLTTSNPNSNPNL